MSLTYTREEVVSSWRQTSHIASISAARLNLNKNTEVINVSLTGSQKHFGKEESIKFQTNFAVEKNNLNVLSQSNPADISNEKLKAYGATNNLIAILREIPGNKSAKNQLCQILEIWKNGYLNSSIDIGQLDKNGTVYTDGIFGCFEFSPDDKQLVYVAEKKAPKKQPYLRFGISATPEETKVGAEYEFVEDWGEQLVGKSQPVICIFNVDWEPFNIDQDSAVKVIEPTDSNEKWSPGQMIWCSNDQLAGIALSHHPRRLGRIFHSNRPGRLFKINVLTGEYEWFGSEMETANSPRYNPDNGSILYLKSKAFGPHQKEQKITIIESNGSIRQIDAPTGPKYQGMYGSFLPDRCISKDGRSIIFSTPCKSSIQSYILNLESGDIQQLALPGGCTGCDVLDILDDLVLVNGVSLVRPDQLFIGRIDWTKLKSKIEWKRLTSGNELPTEHSLSSDLLTFKTPDAMEFEAMLVYRKDSSAKTPLIVSPHGGPHSVFTDQFKLESYFFTQLGFAVLYVNYRGSTGFGEKALNSLSGNIGVQDVQECHQATLEALEKYSFLDKDSVFLWGGSHGGFIVTHLVGQFPNFYKAVSARNTVINGATKFTTGDSPTSSIVGSGLGDGSELEGILNAKTLGVMFDCSPIKYASQVKAPTLLLVGKVDRRVHHSQSTEFYRALKLCGKKVKMLMYEDNHSLTKLPFNSDALINTVLWFQESVNITNFKQD